MIEFWKEDIKKQIRSSLLKKAYITDVQLNFKLETVIQP